MVIRPITFRQACDFIAKYHRHHSPTIGCKFCIGVFVDETMVGCAVCGRPVSRVLDDGLTLEINRVCTDGTRNACSMLYGACCRIAKAMGYQKAITYTLQSESGASLKASNFTSDGTYGAKHWTGKRCTHTHTLKNPQELKIRWSKVL